MDSYSELCTWNIDITVDKDMVAVSCGDLIDQVCASHLYIYKLSKLSSYIKGWTDHHSQINASYFMSAPLKVQSLY